MQKVLEIHMNEVIKIKKDNPLAKVLTKIIADKKVINEHIAKGGHLSDLKGKIGLNNAI